MGREDESRGVAIAASQAHAMAAWDGGSNRVSLSLIVDEHIYIQGQSSSLHCPANSARPTACSRSSIDLTGLH